MRRLCRLCLVAGDQDEGVVVHWSCAIEDRERYMQNVPYYLRLKETRRMSAEQVDTSADPPCTLVLTQSEMKGADARNCDQTHYVQPLCVPAPALACIHDVLRATAFPTLSSSAALSAPPASAPASAPSSLLPYSLSSDIYPYAKEISPQTAHYVSGVLNPTFGGGLSPPATFLRLVLEYLSPLQSCAPRLLPPTPTPAQVQQKPPSATASAAATAAAASVSSAAATASADGEDDAPAFSLFD